MPINPAREAPLYREVGNELVETIARGDWQPGAAIPAESRLAAQFGVSIGTVRKAVDALVAEQILVRHQGRGTFVTTHDSRRLMFHFFHIVGADGIKRFPEIETLDFRHGRADAECARRLAISPADKVIHIRNLLALDTRPIIVDDITLPAESFPGLSEKIFVGRDNTIYQLYQSRYGINVLRTDEKLRAIAAPAEIASLLDVRPRSPVLEIRRVAMSYRGKPVEWRISRVNTTAHEYENTFGKGEGLRRHS